MMVDLTRMDPHHGQEPTILDVVHHVPAAPSSPASSKMNGSIHLRHNMNISSMSASSSKHSGTSNGFVVGEPKSGGALLQLSDHGYSCAELPQEHRAVQQQQQQSKNFHQLRFYCRQQHIPEVLGCLALLSIVSILLAFVAIIFFLRVTPITVTDVQAITSAEKERLLSSNDHMSVYEVVRGLIMCTISLNFTCFLVCAIQFLFAAKLLRIVSHGEERAHRYLQECACSRKMAICGFFISIPVFLTAIILYAFIQFQTMSAIVSAAVLGVGIIFSGIAMIHNVYLWQKELSRCTRTPDKEGHRVEPVIVDGLPSTSLNASHVPYMELSTLV